ncbi:MAG TPA: hypothetical protein VMM55_14300 [Thermohalobaculum sp.]|nr:hypothetical protein [Thermohalobaculum sp.]
MPYLFLAAVFLAAWWLGLTGALWAFIWPALLAGAAIGIVAGLIGAFE